MADTEGTELVQTDAQKTSTLRMGQYATALNDITIPYFTDVLAPLDDVLISKGGLQALKFYDEIERDPHAYAVLTKRKAQLVSREWIVRPGGESALDIKAAAFIEDVLTGIDFDEACKALLDATLKGFAVSEAVYRRDGRHRVLDRMVSLEQRRFVFDLDWRPRLVTTTNLLANQIHHHPLSTTKIQVLDQMDNPHQSHPSSEMVTRNLPEAVSGISSTSCRSTSRLAPKCRCNAFISKLRAAASNCSLATIRRISFCRLFCTT